MQLDELFVPFVAVTAMLESLKPVAMQCPQRANEVLRELTFCDEFVETVHRRPDGLPTCCEFLDSVGMTLAEAGFGKPKCTDYGGQHQTLAHERYQNDREREEENPIAVRKERATLDGEWNC